MSGAHTTSSGSGTLHVHHHFDSAEQQYQSSKLGLWLFLVTEVLLFGGLFVAYIIFRVLYPDAFHEAHVFLDKVMGTTNTVVLITSSFTMAMAVRATKMSNRAQANLCLIITLLCGAAFMVIKGFEYSHKFHEGLLPGGLFTNTEIHAPAAKLFFSLYFMMTGLHGIHVLCGMALITWVLVRNMKGQFDAEYYTPVELTGIYWHLVDLIWIYLFPLFYLIG